MLSEDWMARIYDVKGAFLKGKFKDGEEIFMDVLWGVEYHYWVQQLLGYSNLYMN